MKLLHEDASPETLNVVRFWVFGLWCLKLATDPLHQLAELPLSMFHPVAPLTWFPTEVYPLLLSSATLTALRVLAALSALASALAWRDRWMAPLCCFLLTLQQAVIRSYGSINHAEIPLLLGTYAFVLFAWADSAWRRRNGGSEPSMNHNAYPIVAVVLILCLTYTFTGVHRLVHGGWEVFASDSMAHWAHARSVWDAEHDFGYGRYWGRDPVFSWTLRLGLPVVTILEVLAPVCLVSPRFRLLFVLIMVPFHVGTILVMNINFWESLCLYTLFLDVDRRESHAVPHTREPSTIFFDGICGLCNGFVDWMLARDGRKIFRFAPLQGTTAAHVFGPRSNTPDAWSIVLVDETGSHERSEAVLRAVSRLGGLWWLAGLLRWIPLPLRDRVYDRVARVRYEMFGQRATCRVPTLAERTRFLE
jgi:predicted DCC family thiol-disulfide oxidoreductase YuxK